MTTINIHFQLIIKDDETVKITVPETDQPIGVQDYSKICKALAEAEHQINIPKLILKLSKPSNDGNKSDE